MQKRIKYIVVHHLGFQFNGDDSEAIDLIQNVRLQHMAKNWGNLDNPTYQDDISYHVALNPQNGKLFYLNSPNEIMWHDSHNIDSIGFLILGDGNTQEWSHYIEAGLVRFMIEQRKWLGLSKKDIIGHRDRRNTECPGDNYYEGLLKFKSL